MKNCFINYFLLFSFAHCFFSLPLVAQIPAIQWQKSLGGSGDEHSSQIIQTSDGGYLVACYSTSSDGDVSFHYGQTLEEDYWVVKLNSCGIIEWEKTFGGTNLDQPLGLIELPNGEYIVSGQSQSSNGDVKCLHEDGILGSSYDFWVIRLDPDGNLLQQKCFGGSNDDGGGYIIATTDGGYIIAGISASSDGDVTNHHYTIAPKGDIFSQYDYWVVKLNANLDIQWEKCLGGSSADMLNDIIQTNDGGYALCGQSYSSDGEVTVNYGYSDVWIVKLDNNGNIQWEKSYGGASLDSGNSIYQHTDNGYIVTCSTNFDAWILRLDQFGNVIWEEIIAGNGADYLYTIIALPDLSYMIAGYTNSTDLGIPTFHGGYDCWLVHLDANGTVLEQKCYGGSNDEYLYKDGFIKTNDQQFILSSLSASNDGDVSGHHTNNGFFGTDLWIVKLGNPFPPGAAPVLSSSLQENNVSIFVDSTLNFNVIATNGSSDSITLKWNKRSVFPAGILFNDTTGYPTLSSEFEWTPNCNEWKNRNKYEIAIFAYNKRCQVDYLTINAEILVKPIDYNSVKVYNLCTPNGDDKNDLFVLPVLPNGYCNSEFSFIEINNRYGSRIYYSKNPVDTWNPSDYPDGIYYYYVRYNNAEFKGWLQIIR